LRVVPELEATTLSLVSVHDGEQSTTGRVNAGVRAAQAAIGGLGCPRRILIHDLVPNGGPSYIQRDAGSGVAVVDVGVVVAIAELGDNVRIKVSGVRGVGDVVVVEVHIASHSRTEGTTPVAVSIVSGRGSSAQSGKHQQCEEEGSREHLLIR